MVKAGDVRKALRKRRDLGGAERDKKVKTSHFWSRTPPCLASATAPVYQLSSLAKPE